MKKVCYALLFAFSPLLAYSQGHHVLLKSGTIFPAATNPAQVQANSSEMVNGRYYRFIQFSNIPSAAQKQELARKGIKLYNYIPGNTFMASIAGTAKFSTTDNIYAVFAIEPQHKYDELLAKKAYPGWAMRGKTKIELVVTHHPDISHNVVAEWLAAEGAEVLHSLPNIDAFRIITDTARISALAALPCLYYLEPMDDEPQPDNLVGKTDHRSNMISTSYSTGLKYDGTGINVALNDDGVIGPHIDYTGRLISQYISFNSGNHGDHCAGTIFGAGNRNPTTAGMATGANLGVYGVSGSFPTGYQAFDSIYNHYNSKEIRITSTSYSNGNSPGYTSLAQLMDQQTNDMPQLIHVFSAGNTGTSDFGYGAGAGWGNVTGGHKQAKNVIATANLDYMDNLAGSSSRGPAKDGRIKPDISAVGSTVYSTIDPNTYENKTGTSMACPGIAGIMAQLYHAYKSLNGGNYPPSALMKAVLLNTADDIGNPGPDYRHGWGRVNAHRAYKVIQANQYIHDSVTNTGIKNHTIAVPSGVAELRVMVYWHDYIATVNAAPALVNNLNMMVTDPSSAVTLPWVLNPAPNATTLNLPAVRGTDVLNNMEQVTIANPASGNYTVSVNGVAVPQGPQKYYVVYEFVTLQPTLTYPSGGESLVPGVSETIRWDAHGNSGTFTLQYSTNNGTNWTNIATNISASQRYYNWTPPSVVTSQALVRVTRASLSDQSDATFSIIGVPTSLTVNWVCIDSMSVTYPTVTGATGYIVSVLGNEYMDSAGFSTTGTCVVKNIQTRNGGWVSVQAVGPNGCIGRRLNAVSFVPVPFNCTAPQDVEFVSFTSPLTNTIVDCAPGSPAGVSVSVLVRNNSFIPISNLFTKYSINGNTPVSTIHTGPILVGDTATIAFTQIGSIPNTTGLHDIKAWFELSSVANAATINDTGTMQKEVVISSGTSLPFIQDFESFNLCSTTADCAQSSCILSGPGWINEPNSFDGTDWRINSGATPTRTLTGLTGPLQDYKPGTAAGKYAYLEASQCFSKEAHMITPCITIPAATEDIMFSFAYHMFGTDMGVLHVDVKADNVWVNDVITPLSGNKGNNWTIATAQLNNYKGKSVNIRFRGNTGTGENSDMAIDNISIMKWGNVSGNQKEMQVNVYPNPSGGKFNLSLSGATSGINITITDISGKTLQQHTLSPISGSINTTLHLGDVAPGLYILVIKNEQGLINNYKLVKM